MGICYIYKNIYYKLMNQQEQGLMRGMEVRYKTRRMRNPQKRSLYMEPNYNQIINYRCAYESSV